MRRSLLVALLTLLTGAAPAPAADPPTIVGGQESSREWPFMVYLNQGRQEFELEPSNYCGGSLIAPTWVMTAAHCITDEVIDPLITTVVIGRRSQSNDEGERIQAKRIVVHEEYADNGTPDVALIELERSPQAPVTVQIAAAGEEALYAPGTMATILGWGHTSDGGSGSDVLKEAQVPIVSDESCGQTYSDDSWGWTAAEMICAGFPEGGTDTCQGDSGGPLIVPVPDGTWRQVGITSFGEGCAKAGWPGVYAEASGQKIREWVRSFVPAAIAPAPAAAPPSAPAPVTQPPAQPAPASQPAGSRRSKPAPKASKALRRCLKKAGKSKRKQRACRRKHRR